MTVCGRCGLEKPKDEVFLGVCNDCFAGRAPTERVTDAPVAERQKIPLTTSIEVPGRRTESVISIVASEAALGLNVFKDIANNFRDFFGGRSATSQNALRDARLLCLEELEAEAISIGADAVIAVTLNYNQLATGSSGGILFVAATGTAVKLAPPLHLSENPSGC